MSLGFRFLTKAILPPIRESVAIIQKEGSLSCDGDGDGGAAPPAPLRYAVTNELMRMDGSVRIVY